jgi:hypothetical protein
LNIVSVPDYRLRPIDSQQFHLKNYGSIFKKIKFKICYYFTKFTFYQMQSI